MHTRRLQFKSTDQLERIVRGAMTRIQPTGRNSVTGFLSQVDFTRLWMQQFTESAARTAHTTIAPGRVAVIFQSSPGLCLRDGHDLHPGTLLLAADNSDFVHRTVGPTRLAAMSLPVEDFIRAGEVLIGRDLRDRTAACSNVTVPLHQYTRLVQAHAAAIELAATVRKPIDRGHESRAVEASLIEVWFDAIAQGQYHADTSAQRRRSTVLRRALACIEEADYAHVSLTELCVAANVNRRTLELVFQDRLGMSPQRWMQLRRLDAARRVLLRQGPGAVSVTHAAVMHGFYDLGRFARRYRDHFGELPSATLARSSRADTPELSHLT
jgi:AraC-like DNA-binding protein